MAIKEELTNILQISDALKIYVYGGGVIGQFFSESIYGLYGIKINAFIKTNPEVAEKINDIPVISVDNFVQKDAVIVVAVLKNLRESICNELDKRNLSFFYLAEPFINELRMKYVNPVHLKAMDKLRLSDMYEVGGSFGNAVVIVNDYGVKANIPFAAKEYNVTMKEFMHNEYNSKLSRVDSIVVMNVNWEENFKSFFGKIFSSEKKLFLSLKSVYLKNDEFDFINEMKKAGYQISGWHSFVYSYDVCNTDNIIAVLEKRKPNSLKKDKLCNGCGKCELDCPKDAITIKPDNYFNYKPFVDLERCISCGLCLKECPAYDLHNEKKDDIGHTPECYALMATDEIRYRSSSGGAFEILAKPIFEKNGFVVGAAWKDKVSVEHIIINDEKDLWKLQKSKYMRSDIIPALERIKMLKTNKPILFTGLPCQIAAAKGYLKNKEFKNIIYVDLLCTQAPSDKLFKKYTEECFEISEVKRFEFRHKDSYWKSDAFKVYKNNGEELVLDYADPYQAAYHGRMMMPVHCEKCNFAEFPRQGDITIGDFWGIYENDKTMDDFKGTSSLLVNSKKGCDFFEQNVEKNKQVQAIKKTPLDWLKKYNRTTNETYTHIYRDKFYDLINISGFTKTVSEMSCGRYEVGLVGDWSTRNYGCELTYYALGRYLEECGKSVIFIEWPEDSYWKPLGMFGLFEKNPFLSEKIAFPAKDKKQMKQYNYACKKFVQGSDQLLHPFLYDCFQGTVMLEFAFENKKKIAYALSCGDEKAYYRETVHEEIKQGLKKFNAVSIREKSAQQFFKKEFDCETTHVVDPVFLCNKNNYLRLADMVTDDNEPKKDYIFSYILDVNNEKLLLLKNLSKKLNLSVVVVTDAEKQRSYDEINFEGTIITEVSAEKWLKYIINASFVVTDSFHGTCFSIIFEKQFISLINKGRGAARFYSLLESLELKDRIISESIDKADSVADEKIEFADVNRMLKKYIEFSKKWLNTALEGE